MKFLRKGLKKFPDGCIIWASANCAEKRENFANAQKPDRFCRGHLNPLWGKGLEPFFREKRNDVHVRKWQKRSKMTFLDQNPILRACPTRAPGHRVACTLLPFTVLKLEDYLVHDIYSVACTLLPFTVLKLLELLFSAGHFSALHAPSYRLRY